MGGKMALYRGYLLKGDMLIIALVLLSALVGFLMLPGRLAANSAGLYAEIYVDGQLRESVSLTTAREIRLESGDAYNVLYISPQGICMLATNCPNQDCVQTGPQNRPGAMIACLPHRVLVRLSGHSGDGGVDAIAY